LLSSVAVLSFSAKTAPRSKMTHVQAKFSLRNPVPTGKRLFLLAAAVSTDTGHLGPHFFCFVRYLEVFFFRPFGFFLPEAFFTTAAAAFCLMFDKVFWVVTPGTTFIMVAHCQCSTAKWFRFHGSFVSSLASLHLFSCFSVGGP